MTNLKVAKNKPKSQQSGVHVSVKTGTNTKVGIVLEGGRPLLPHTGIAEITETGSAATITIIVTADQIVAAQTESKSQFILIIILGTDTKK